MFKEGQTVFITLDGTKVRGKIKEIFAESNKLLITLEDNDIIVVDMKTVSIKKGND